jgi:ribosomal protein L23
MATKKTTKEEGKVEAKFIIAPRITEKASAQSSHNAFTFVVKESATKRAIVEEIKKEYKVTPKAVNITNLPKVNVFVRGKHGVKKGMKKAVVFLKKGDTIKLA